ncbi:7378_t:CDS:2, partial [Diversispora eburnea]
IETYEDDVENNIFLIGRTGSGKSTLANEIRVGIKYRVMGFLGVRLIFVTSRDVKVLDQSGPGPRAKTDRTWSCKTSPRAVQDLVFIQKIAKAH